MKNSPFKFVLTIAISLVWLINGLFCKVLNLVPRHQLIVARILGEDYSGLITKAIGLSEILMFLWVLSKLKSRWWQTNLLWPLHLLDNPAVLSTFCLLYKIMERKIIRNGYAWRVLNNLDLCIYPISLDLHIQLKT